MPIVRLGAIHIIESLPTDDLKTGELLYAHARSFVQQLRPEMTVHFWREETPAALLGRLRQIAEDTRSSGRAPIVHFETHGRVDCGLWTTAGRYVWWSDLKGPLTEINTECGLNMLVVVAACDGAGLVEVLQVHDRAPVCGLIGSFGEVMVGVVEAGMLAFYRTLLSTVDVDAALAALNSFVKPGDPPFRLYDAEWFFREVLGSYFERQCTEDALARRTAQMVEQARQDAEAEGRITTPEVLALLTDQFAARVRDPHWIFNWSRGVFFMEDLHPDHATRFKVSLADCQR